MKLTKLYYSFDPLFYSRNRSFPFNISSKALFYKIFAQKSYFCGSRGISLSMGRDAGRGKVAYIWISSDPAKAGPSLGGGGVENYIIVAYIYLVSYDMYLVNYDIYLVSYDIYLVSWTILDEFTIFVLYSQNIIRMPLCHSKKMIEL